MVIAPPFANVGVNPPGYPIDWSAYCTAFGLLRIMVLYCCINGDTFGVESFISDADFLATT